MSSKVDEDMKLRVALQEDLSDSGAPLCSYTCTNTAFVEESSEERLSCVPTTNVCVSDALQRDVLTNLFAGRIVEEAETKSENNKRVSEAEPKDLVSSDAHGAQPQPHEAPA
ncbi:unnamed protein product [Pleuronectes platessa]|uniref:Uncharacterized protein n=1 Tax=Pleuronectes platessa TaxID=8262 RepID=A0A9N7W278_PLEPL|nr:unnamed protein product [Pleuronectes platessa]